MVSSFMNNNKSRDEKDLVRMSQNTRNYMGFDSQVELWPETENPIEGKIKQAVLLNIFHSYKKDVKRIKTLVNDGELSSEESNRVGFVTKDVYDRIINGDNNNVWISETTEEIPIGADPEFLLFDKDGNVISAARIPNFSYYAQIGSDGAMAEIRPDPAITADGLVGNIRKLFNDENLTEPIEDFQWKSGCYYRDASRSYPIGGHIHFGNPLRVHKIDTDSRMNFFRIANKILDELLSIPMMRLDGHIGNGRRTQSNMGFYGYFGECRMAAGRLEHRTLSGVWLSHPELAEAVIGTAKAIMEEIYRHVENRKFDLSYMTHDYAKSSLIFDRDFNQWGEIQLTKDLKCVRSSEEMHDILNKSDFEYVNSAFLKKWYSRMKSMSNYEQYSTSIDKLYAILKAPEKKILSLNTNLRDGWVNEIKFDI